LPAKIGKLLATIIRRCSINRWASLDTSGCRRQPMKFTGVPLMLFSRDPLSDHLRLPANTDE
jgi:hypothetical protein